MWEVWCVGQTVLFSVPGHSCWCDSWLRVVRTMCWYGFVPSCSPCSSAVLKWEALSLSPPVGAICPSWCKRQAVFLSLENHEGLGSCSLRQVVVQMESKQRQKSNKEKESSPSTSCFFFFANFWIERKLCRKTEARCCLHSGYNYKYLRSVEMFPLLGWKAQCTSSVCCSKTDPISWCSSTADLLFYCYLAH